MKKIAVVSVEDTLNYGSAMMGINLIYYLSKKLGANAAFLIDVFTTEDFERINTELKFKVNLGKLRVPRKNSKNSKIPRLTEQINFFKENIAVFSENPTGVVDVGGDNFGEYYYGKGVVLDLLRVFFFSIKSRFFIVGQTIGPFFSWRKPLATALLKYSYIYPRNPLKNDYAVQTLGLRRVIEARDLAFLDLPNQTDPSYQNNVLKQYGLFDCSYLCVVPSGLYRFYTNNYDDYVASWVKIINSLLDNSQLKSYKIVLLPHVLSAHNDDRKVIRDILQHLSNDKRDCVQFISDVLLPSQARCLLGGGLFTVTARMHAAVSTFQMHKPAICIAASVKFNGVVGEGLGSSDLIVKADDKGLWRSGEISEKVAQKVDYVVGNYDTIILRITAKVEDCKTLALAQINDIAEKIQ
ncbi:MAG: polysaccharide pyruvyl transferase family protein [Candidatus Bathyarchaeota archaeon]|nr:polysaccharide pyruvyl transferase family protein [Candidatus Bathyarchaeota archaeon]